MIFFQQIASLRFYQLPEGFKLCRQNWIAIFQLKASARQHSTVEKFVRTIAFEEKMISIKMWRLWCISSTVLCFCSVQWSRQAQLLLYLALTTDIDRILIVMRQLEFLLLNINRRHYTEKAFLSKIKGTDKLAMVIAMKFLTFYRNTSCYFSN